MVVGLLIITPYALTAVIVLYSVLAPWLEYLRLPISAHFYATLHNFCHQLPSRSFFLMTSNFGLCARCEVLYASIFMTSTVVLLRPETRINFNIFLLMLAPCIIDGATQYLGYRLSTNTLRAFTGLLAGASFALYMYPRYIYIVKKIIQVDYEQ